MIAHNICFHVSFSNKTNIWISFLPGAICVTLISDIINGL